MRNRAVSNWKRKGWKFLVPVICCLYAAFFTSCSNTRYLTEDQVLYKGVKKINIRTPKGVKPTANQKHVIHSTLSVSQTNPIKLWVYNRWKPAKDKGLKHFIYRKFGEKPILVSDLKLDLRVKTVELGLEDVGSFNAKVDYKILPYKNNKKAKVRYDVILEAPYKYRRILYPGTGNAMDSIISRTQRSSKILPGDIYSLDDMKSERARIAESFRNAGYYYFKPEFIDVVADTIGLNHLMDISFALRKDIPPAAMDVWRIRDISFYLGGDPGNLPDSAAYKDVNVYYRQPLQMKPGSLYENTLFSSGGRYSYTAQSRTVRNLNSLGVFKFINLRFNIADSVNHLFDLKLQADYLNPLSAELELDGVWKTNDLAGPEIVASIKHGNLFKGGERFSIGVNGSYQWQVAGEKGSKMNSYEVGLNLSLALPRTLDFGLFRSREKRWYASQTTIQTGVDLLNRPKYFQMVSFNTELNYSWQASRTVNHSFSPVKVTFTSLLHTTREFDSIALVNPAIASSFHDQCIPQIVYKFTYDKTFRPLDKHRLFWQATASTAGNLVYLVKHSFYKDSVSRSELFNKPYSQFGKLTSDLRYFYSFRDRKQIAVRLYAGAAIPYGNSKVVPYTEQFYSGGANSLRAFQVRGIGPGTYHPDAVDAYSYWDQTGDIKLEGNLEYRFPLGRSLYGALFVDAGNIWLYNEDTMRPGGQFKWNSFYKELALGTGFGLRYDLDFLVIRADVGVPVHTPYNPEPDSDKYNNKYYNIPDFIKGLTLYIAIGYPF